MKRYIQPNIETIEMPSIQPLCASGEEGSQVTDAMSNGNDGAFEYESDMEENTNSWLKSNAIWK